MIFLLFSTTSPLLMLSTPLLTVSGRRLYVWAAGPASQGQPDQWLLPGRRKSLSHSYHLSPRGCGLAALLLDQGRRQCPLRREVTLHLLGSLLSKPRLSVILPPGAAVPQVLALSFLPQQDVVRGPQHRPLWGQWQLMQTTGKPNVLVLSVPFPWSWSSRYSQKPDESLEEARIMSLSSSKYLTPAGHVFCVLHGNLYRGLSGFE